MAIKSMNMSWITVSDIKKSRQFFHDILGLDINTDSPEFGWLELSAKQSANNRLGVGQANPEYGTEKPGTNAVVTFTVDDIVQEKKRLEALQVKFLGDILEVPGHVKLATFVDADGNKFQLAEMLETK